VVTRGCEARKPALRMDSCQERDQVVRVLQYGVREGHEASEDVLYPVSFYCKLHQTVHLANFGVEVRDG